MYKRLEVSDICIVNINDTKEVVGRIFATTPSETIFVIDNNQYLYGIITIGDFSNHSAKSDNIAGLMNENYKKIVITDSDKPNEAHVQSCANEIFSVPYVMRVPIVSDGKLLYVIERDKTKNHQNNVFFLNKKKIEDLTSYDRSCNKLLEKPLLRVISTTYNNVEFARYNLNGILMQKTDFPFEVYIYDDCSTDGTSDIVREYAQKYPNIIAVIQPQNLWSTDKNLRRKILWDNTINHNAKYVAWCDGDDYWIDPYKLQIQVDFLENNSDFSICSGSVITNNNFTGEQHIDNVISSVSCEYDFSNRISYSFTRVQRVDSIPAYETTIKYKYFCDLHMAYYALKKGKGYHFSRIFGVYNWHQNGVWNGLDEQGKIIFQYNTSEELYRETRDIQVRNKFIRVIPKYVAICLKNEKEKSMFLEKVVKMYPEISNDIKLLY